MSITNGDLSTSGFVTAWSMKVLGPASSAPLPSFSIGDVSVVEGNSGTVNAVFTVRRSGSQAASVDFATANGTATASSGDYVAVAKTTLNFAANEASKSITVLVKGDTAKRVTRHFT